MSLLASLSEFQSLKLFLANIYLSFTFGKFVTALMELTRFSPAFAFTNSIYLPSATRSTDFSKSQDTSASNGGPEHFPYL